MGFLKFLKNNILHYACMVAVATMLSCINSSTQTNNDAESLNNFDWLIGNWIRTNEMEPKITHERWTKASNTEYIGMGFTLQSLDTIFKEEIRLVKMDKKWIYEVSGVNDSPTLFELSTISENSFVCENDENEFPKKIKYTLLREELIAIISDENTEISFHFKRLSP
ncbi:MAG: hypothetical protein KKG99_13855 [Bacteroidetes bacterium]|nr:hypothetical protein [Bacteroidota bacterium]